MISRAFAPVLLLVCSGCLRQIADAPARSQQSSTAKPASAQREVPPPPTRPDVPDEPSPREVDHAWMSRASWWKRHWALVDIGLEQRKEAELVFIGDSITEGFDDRVWREFYEPHHALRLGIGGDKTQNVLFRLEDGEIDGISPKVAVLMIGTNNLGAWPADAIARGVSKIVQSLLVRLPRTQVLVVGILPRDQQPDSPKRTEVADTNALLAKLADGARVHYVDLGAALLSPDGSIDPAVMADFLHPTARGYRQFAEALKPTLEPLISSCSCSGNCRARMLTPALTWARVSMQKRALLALAPSRRTLHQGGVVAQAGSGIKPRSVTSSCGARRRARRGELYWQ